MIAYEQGDVVLVLLTFADESGDKRGPAVILHTRAIITATGKRQSSPRLPATWIGCSSEIISLRAGEMPACSGLRRLQASSALSNVP